jgi:AcrR family transcriptional regulator
MDERVAITKESLRTALLLQMEQVGFQKISVRSLAAKAGVNRTTFYLHYEDKYDLLDQIEADLLDHLRTIILDGMGRLQSINMARKVLRGAAEQVFAYIKEQEFEFAVLLGPRGDPGFVVKYGEMIAQIFTSERMPITPVIPSEYLTAVVSGAHIGIVRAWILRGMEESPEEMALVVSSFIQGVLKELVKLQLKPALHKPR